MPHAIDECYRGVPGHKPLEPQLRLWDEELEREYPSHDPRKNDGRYPSDGYHRAQMAYLDSKGLGHGAGHFGLWHARGQQSSQTSKSNGPYCHIFSEDTCGGPHTLPEKDRKSVELPSKNTSYDSFLSKRLWAFSTRSWHPRSSPNHASSASS